MLMRSKLYFHLLFLLFIGKGMVNTDFSFNSGLKPKNVPQFWRLMEITKTMVHIIHRPC